jgi:hypothetical protein
MFRRLLLFAWLGLMVVLVTNCKGPQGDVGPQGETGAQGPAGPTGPAGEDGQNGGGSGAFILSSGADETDSTGGYITGIPDLTPELDTVLQSSAILVYVKSQNVYWPLPGLVLFGNAASQFTFVHGIQSNTFFVELFQTGWSEDVDDAPKRTFQDVRIVIIPGTVLGGRLDAETLKSYEKTIASLGLTDKDVKVFSGVKNIKLLRKK